MLKNVRTSMMRALQKMGKFQWSHTYYFFNGNQVQNYPWNLYNPREPATKRNHEKDLNANRMSLICNIFVKYNFIF